MLDQARSDSGGQLFQFVEDRGGVASLDRPDRLVQQGADGQEGGGLGVPPCTVLEGAHPEQCLLLRIADPSTDGVDVGCARLFEDEALVFAEVLDGQHDGLTRGQFGLQGVSDEVERYALP